MARTIEYWDAILRNQYRHSTKREYVEEQRRLNLEAYMKYWRYASQLPLAVTAGRIDFYSKVKET